MDEIYDTVLECTGLFEELVTADRTADLNSSKHRTQYDVKTIQEAEDSLQLWINYTGALAADTSRSLDARLQKHGDIKEMVLELLNKLQRNLRHLCHDLENVDDSEPDTEAQDAIQLTLEDLHFMATAIRRSSVRSFDYNSSSLSARDEHSYFAQYAALLVRNYFPHARRSLSEHLGTSIAVRRKALLHKIQHEAKLGARRQRAAVPANRAPDGAETQTASVASSQQQEIQNAGRQVAEHRAPVPSTNSVSTLDTAQFRRRILRPSAMSTTGSGVSVRLPTSTYPQQPKFATSDVQCRCPYCGTLIPTRHLRGRETFWQKHIDADLESYVCLSEECTMPFLFFANMGEWLDHMVSVHSEEWSQVVHMKTWYCDTGHEAVIQFNNLESFLEHFRDPQAHGGRKPPTDVQLDTLSRKKQRTVLREELVCPLCDSVPDSIRPIMPTADRVELKNNLHKHIAEHLKTLAFKSLPVLENTDVDNDEVSVAEDRERGRLRAEDSEPSLPSGYDQIVQETTVDFDDEQASVEEAEIMERSDLKIPESSEKHWSVIGYDEYRTARKEVQPVLPDAILSHFARKQGYGSTSVSRTDPSITQQKDREKKLDQDVLSSLRFREMLARRYSIAPPHKNTCQWIFQLPEYQSWHAEACGLLWIKGKPGTGKSTLMSHLYSTERLSLAVGTVCVEYFFNARGAKLERSPLGMLRSLAYQIFFQVPSVRQLLRASYQDKMSSSDKRLSSWDWQRAELEELVTNMILAAARERQVVVFIDALNEADEQDDGIYIARYFHSVNDRALHETAAIRTCISCRHYPVLSTHSGREIWVERHNSDDIEGYVRDQFNDRNMSQTGINSHGYYDWRALSKLLWRKAEGSFAWVRLAIPLVERKIDDGGSNEEIEMWLSRVPWEVSDLYNHILEHVVDSGYWRSTQRLFMWVCLATRSLSLTELRYALATYDIVVSSAGGIRCQQTSRFVGTDERMRLEIQSSSGGLIEVLDGPENMRAEVKLVHSSVNDFMQIEGFGRFARFPPHHADRDEVPAEFTDVETKENIAMHHGELYWSCLKYLVTEAKALATDGYQEVPLAEYAVRNILTHAFNAQGHRPKGDLRVELRFLERALPMWTSTWARLKVDSHTRLRLGASPLHVAAAANLTDFALFLLAQDVDVNAHDMGHQTALHVAVRCRHLALVKILVEAGANVQAMTDAQETPLVLAADQGQPELFSYLLEHCSKLSTATSMLGTALYTAASSGQVIITRFCIEAGADVNTQGERHRNALAAALRAGHDEVVELLIEAGARVNIQGGYYGNALQTASVYGKEKIVRMLLKAGADVNACRGEYGYALQAASARGYEEVVNILLEAGADVNARGGFYGSALRAATVCGHRKVVQMLVKAGAENVSV